MQSKIILASLVAAVSANNLLSLRQVGSPLGDLSKECQSDLMAVQSASDLPAVPTAFISDALRAAQTLTDPCAYTPTGTVAAEYTSFVSAAESWASSHTSIASKIEKDCSVALQNIANLCTAGGAGKTTSGSGSDASATEEASGSGASATTSSGDAKATSDGKTSAAANGPVAAGVLMVAALGAVALL